MSWKDSLRPASFRGVEFKVEGHEGEFGRRQATHEYPGRDEPYTEDLGRKAREYTVDAYLIGDDYIAVRDRLITAAETAGAGELVHPYLGNLQVVCTGLKVRESSDEGRMCRAQLTFTEAGKNRFPTTETDAVSKVTGAASTAKLAAKAGFLERYLTKGMPSFVLDAITGQLGSLSSLLGSLPFNPLGEIQAVAAFFNRVRALVDEALDLITDPDEMVDSIVGVVASTRDVYGDRAEAVLTSIREANMAPFVGVQGTPSRLQQRENFEALSALVRRVAVAELCHLAVLRAEDSAQAVTLVGADEAAATALPGLFQTREDAIAARDALLEAIDGELEDPATTTAEFQAFTALRAEVVRGIPSPTLRLPQVAEIRPRATLPSLVVSYAHYGTAARASEIATRNRARHPGFLRGGEPLQVIANG